MRLSLILACILCLAAAPELEYEPTSNYTIQYIEGWTVYVNNTLLNEQKALGDKTLQLLRVKLYDINRVVSKRPLLDLHRIAIWVEYKHPRHPCACYHPSKDWLMKNGFNPEKAKSVEISNCETFLKWTIEQPWMVLHELAHGYHQQFAGYDNADIKAAYEKAVEGRKYESVLRYNGKMQRHYALNNDQEYFAEATEAYFGVNDYYPFIRAELMKHDPDGYALMETIWGKPTR